MSEVVEGKLSRCCYAGVFAGEAEDAVCVSCRRPCGTVDVVAGPGPLDDGEGVRRRWVAGSLEAEARERGGLSEWGPHELVDWVLDRYQRS